MQTVITRKAASDAALPHFYTGKVCCNGHDAPRFVSNGGCVECNRDRMKTFNSDSRKARVSRLRRHFSYPLHPDDMAAALAYCQALDMQRARVPHVPQAKQVPGEVTPEEIQRIRETAFHVLKRPDAEPYLPKL